jgi:hypothetical protein
VFYQFNLFFSIRYSELDDTDGPSLARERRWLRDVRYREKKKNEKLWKLNIGLRQSVNVQQERIQGLIACTEYMKSAINENDE